jgi:hypothetical protein
MGNAAAMAQWQQIIRMWEAQANFNVNDYVYLNGGPQNVDGLWIVTKKNQDGSIKINQYKNQNVSQNVSGFSITKAPDPPVGPQAVPVTLTGADGVGAPTEIPLVQPFTSMVEGNQNIYTNNSINSIEENENKILSDLIAFNKAYQAYVECNINTPGVCGDKKTNAQSLLTTLIGSDGKSGKIGNFKTQLGNSSNVTYIPDYKNISDNYYKNLSLRSELDTKLTDLYSTEDSIMNEYKRTYDSTMYTGILLATLATSLLYIVFVKI